MMCILLLITFCEYVCQVLQRLPVLIFNYNILRKMELRTLLCITKMREEYFFIFISYCIHFLISITLQQLLVYNRNKIDQTNIILNKQHYFLYKMIRSDPEMNHRIYFITFDFFQVLIQEMYKQKDCNKFHKAY